MERVPVTIRSISKGIRRGQQKHPNKNVLNGKDPKSEDWRIITVNNEDKLASSLMPAPQ